jgi:tellurite resistance protein TerC
LVTVIALWVGFHLFVLAVLALDLGVLRRKSRVVRPREAVIWTSVWVTLAGLFCAGIWLTSGPERGLQFTAAYLVEYSLSVDNLFVFLLVFAYFQVPPLYRHRLLFWGVLGAFVLRGTLIILGATLVSRFHWLLYAFGALLLYSAAKMMLSKEDQPIDPERNAVLRWARRLLPVASGDTGPSFVVRQRGAWKVTPLFLTLLVIETTDLLFALDSIPAVLGISRDSFIVYTSNVFAILGLRSLFFVIAALMDKFHYLKLGVSAILAFIGGKLLLEPWLPVPLLVSLAIVAGLLAASIVASMFHAAKSNPPALDDRRS